MRLLNKNEDNVCCDKHMEKIMKEFALYSSGLIQELHFFFSVEGGNIIIRCMLRKLYIHIYVCIFMYKLPEFFVYLHVHSLSIPAVVLLVSDFSVLIML